jgi:hypothetical protein
VIINVAWPGFSAWITTIAISPTGITAGEFAVKTVGSLRRPHRPSQSLRQHDTDPEPVTVAVVASPNVHCSDIAGLELVGRRIARKERVHASHVGTGLKGHPAFPPPQVPVSN